MAYLAWLGEAKLGALTMVSVTLEQYLVLKLLKGSIHAVNSGQGLE